jgi:serine/threonine protein kinase
MKLSEVVQNFWRKASEGKTFFNNPQQIIRQRLWAKGQELYEGFEVPGTASKRDAGSSDPEPEQRSPSSVAIASPAVPPRDSPQSRSQADLINSPVPWEKELRGKRQGLYTIDKELKPGERISLYEGTSSNGASVLIKEYRLLEREFNDADAEQRQRHFEDFVDLNYKIGHGPDFRLVKLLDAIVPSQSEGLFKPQRRCYLVTQLISNSMSLEDYLKSQDQRKMNAQQVWQVLQQVLETLRFLHDAYRVRLSSEASAAREILAHGNLSLSSLLIRRIDPSQEFKERNFFIYVTDLALWEHLFYPPGSARGGKIATSTQDLGSVEQDLKALGQVAFSLLSGSINLPDVSSPEFAAQFESDPIWATLQDTSLKHFIQQLLQINTPKRATEISFKSADNALKCLMSLSLQELQPSVQPALIATDQAKKDTHQPWIILLLAALLLLGVGGWSILTKWLLGLNSTPSILQSIGLPSPEQKFLSDIIPPGSSTYLVERGGTWNYALQHTFITGAMKRETLVSELKERVNGLAIAPSGIVKPGALPLANREKIFQKLRAREADIALMRISPEVDKQSLQAYPVAYDGLVAFVAFSDANDPRNVLRQSGGKITLDELRQFYMGTRDTWHGHPVKLFYADESETDIFFEALLMRSEDELEKYEMTKRNSQNNLAPNVAPNIYAQIQNHFENAAQTTGKEEIGIGFDRLSRTYGQCSVYPLAIARNSFQPAVQPLVKVRDGQAISPETDLCNKGSYQVNISALKSKAYPLAYQLGVVSKDAEVGKQFAELLNTVDGQYLMSQVGLFPQMSIQEILNALWRIPNDGENSKL